MKKNWIKGTDTWVNWIREIHEPHPPKLRDPMLMSFINGFISVRDRLKYHGNIGFKVEDVSFDDTRLNAILMHLCHHDRTLRDEGSNSHEA